MDPRFRGDDGDEGGEWLATPRDGLTWMAGTRPAMTV
jgi:hypothetical protein